MGMKAYSGILNPADGYPFPGLWSADLEAKPNDTGYQAMADAIDLALFRDDN